MAGKIKKCLPFTHVYPKRAAGKIGALGFMKLCLNCGKRAVRL